MDLPSGQSAFLWGARQTGKSTFLREKFPDSVHIDLLDSDEMLALSARPARLGERLARETRETLSRPVVIDEIQKVPGLLDEVHRLIETRGLSFILCGSSARRLRRTGVNLLGGRAWRFEMFPLTWDEVPEFDLLRALNRGLLPGIYTQTRYRRSLAAYVRDYLTQEIFNEALARNAAAFARFFDALRYCHGELLNYAAIKTSACGGRRRWLGLEGGRRAHRLAWMRIPAKPITESGVKRSLGGERLRQERKRSMAHARRPDGRAAATEAGGNEQRPVRDRATGRGAGVRPTARSR